MNKGDFVRIVAERAGATQRDTNAIITAAIQVATDALTRGESIAFQGFGRFDVKERGSRLVFDFTKGEKVRHPATLAVVFTPCEELKKAVRQG